MDAIKKKVKTMNQKLRQAQKECEEEETKLAEMDALATKMEEENAEVNEKICSIEDEMDATESKLVEQLKKLSEDEKAAEEGRHIKKQMEANRAKDGNKCGRLDGDLGSMKARIEELKGKIEEFEGQQVACEEELDENDERYEAAVERVGSLEGEATSVANVLKSSENAEAETYRRSEAGSSEIEQLSKRFEDSETLAIQFETETQALEEETDKLEEELSAAKEKFANTQLEIQAAVNEISDM